MKHLENSYFDNLNKVLRDYKRAVPCLLVDIDVLDENLNAVKQQITNDKNIRVVVKSLPSFELIDYVMQSLSTKHLMVFHQPFLTDLSSKLCNQADVLIGKPMPITTAKYYYQHLPEITQGFNPYTQIQWLVDTTTRIEQYINLAKELHKKLRLNIEIDVGLHRGGFSTLKQLQSALQLIQDNSDYVTFSGFMGYDAHVVKLPSILKSKDKALKQANTFYRDCKQLVKNNFPQLWSNTLTFNGGGSPTIALHNTNSPINDIALGSCLVKPTTFDINTLTNYKPACFIATPVLKQFKNTTLPAIERFKSLLNILNRNNQQSFFIYGGFWKADYCYPKGVRQNNLFGASTNQTMINASNNVSLNVDGFVFLRPHQSEFVFLQFGEILPIKNGNILKPWSLLCNY